MGDTTPPDICLSHFIRRRRQITLIDINTLLQSTQYIHVVITYDCINPYVGVILIYTRVYKTLSDVSYSLSLLFLNNVKNKNVS